MPSTWAGVERLVRSVAPQVRFLVASVNGDTCRPIRSSGAATAAPLGSAFKLYVLDALATAIASGSVSWDQKLTVTANVKSLPSGVLQDEPVGTEVSVRQVASDMISLSDNTAADMLAHLVGHAAIEQATRSAHITDPGLDMPFFTTQELFALKLDDWPKLAQRYLALNAGQRQAFLATTVDSQSLNTAGAASWTTPRDPGSLEWFASPTDICHVFASLAGLADKASLRPLSSILGLNKGDMNLDPSQWQSVWFKGGSEPGVLTLSYLATTRAGKSYVVTVLTENPSAAIAESTATPVLLSAIHGAFDLVDR